MQERDAGKDSQAPMDGRLAASRLAASGDSGFQNWTGGFCIVFR
jgi:hypothetical protein